LVRAREWLDLGVVGFELVQDPPKNWGNRVTISCGLGGALLFRNFNFGGCVILISTGATRRSFIPEF